MVFSIENGILFGCLNFLSLLESTDLFNHLGIRLDVGFPLIAGIPGFPTHLYE